jgi:hypothetical protein
LSPTPSVAWKQAFNAQRSQDHKNNRNQRQH